ncbi:MAG TPA: DUF362 domain-containing protein [bacterium]|nr:DUF362 domain-containing protein [bacterium]HOL96030.1 DUF362 domain-containing protein [bacterium]HPP02547.1 DUF362 domain-containing protein [bacterium]HXK94526.1 DUF362 domain-containing protein [bacterium]
MTSCAAAGLGMNLPGWFSNEAFAADQPQMSIARYKESPTEKDAIQEEAEKLTRAAIDALGGMARFISKGDVVWVKPNIGWDRPAELAANTNPDVVATLVKMCYEAGAKQVHVSDNTCNDQKRTFVRSGIQKAAEEAGARVYFLDPRKYKKMAINGKTIKEWEIYADMVEADKLINVPIVKHHGLCEVTLSMKNLMGVIGGARNRYHQDIDNSLPDLAAFVKPDLVVLDAIRVLTRNGPVGGNPSDVARKDLVAAGTDQVALDAFGATLLGHKPEDIGHIKEAAVRGLGTLDYASLSPKELTV